MSSRCSSAPVAASPASFQPSNATTTNGSCSSGRSSEADFGSITPPSLRRSRRAALISIPGPHPRSGGAGGADDTAAGACWTPCWTRSETMVADIGSAQAWASPQGCRTESRTPIATHRWGSPVSDSPNLRPDATAELTALLEQRILVLDGAMGTAIQRDRPDEAGDRGERFADWPTDVQGNNNLLSITAPAIIAGSHPADPEAGAALIETNTFNATSISLSDYGMQELAYELNVASARLARRECDAMTERTPDKPRYVVGALGPTSRTASISPDVNDPGARNVSYDQLVEAYLQQANGLVDGGVDVLLVETIFDTLNAKAAIFALETLFEERDRRWPVMISGTITDASGRTLSGQVTEAFWHSIRHVNPLLVGLNCALGAKEMRPYIAELSRIADTFVSCYPNAGLPNAFGEYDESPEETASILAEFADSGFVNVVGGCCGTTPAHIAAVAAVAEGRTPRTPAETRPALRLAGREPLTVPEESLFVNVGERTNIPGSARFRNLIKAGDYPAALAVARQQVEAGAQVIDINMDEGMIDGVEAMDRFTKLIASEP